LLESLWKWKLRAKKTGKQNLHPFASLWIQQGQSKSEIKPKGFCCYQVPFRFLSGSFQVPSNTLLSSRKFFCFSLPSFLSTYHPPLLFL